MGWSLHPPAEQIVVDEVTSKESTEKTSKKDGPASTVPITDLQALQSEEKPTETPAEKSTVSESISRESEKTRPLEKVRSITELGLTERTPNIVGGIGNLYLHIKYPQKALQEGIEGQLALEFTVQRDGSVANVEVVDSLHPLCDSAAVEGIRSVQFVPAKRSGEPIPLRLHLPVQFQITPTTSSALSQDRSP
ncbi:MAG: energy transducer TonB [Salinibacter sp.]